MARFPRLVIPGLPRHVTQRGNRRQTTFFEEEDFLVYKEGMLQACRQYGVKLWCYCLMPNHVHLVAVPESKESLSKAMGRGHEMYSRYMNFKKKWRGLFWQSRYGSFPMDGSYLYNCCKYIELNPVTAGIVDRPEDYRWSSARAHLGLEDDELIEKKSLLGLVDDWAVYLAEGVEEVKRRQIEKHLRSGRPLGSEDFILELEESTGRDLRLKKPGPRPKI